MDDLATVVARVLAAHREQYPLATGGLAPCVTCHTPYPCVVAEALEPARVILAGGPVLRLHGARCTDCGRPMVAQTSDTAICSCDDDHPFIPDPVKPLCTNCDKPEAYHRG